MKLASVDLGFNVGTLAIGVAAYLFGPTLLSAAGGVLRGAAKSGIKGGLIAYNKGKLLSEEARASLKDLSNEAQAELKESQTAVAKKKA
jgi:hypothetical protein